MELSNFTKIYVKLLVCEADLIVPFDKDIHRILKPFAKKPDSTTPICTVTQDRVRLLRIVSSQANEVSGNCKKCEYE